MSHVPCTDLRSRLGEVIDASLADVELVALRRHALSCATCGALVARHAHMASVLSAEVVVPRVDLRVPVLPDPSPVAVRDERHAAGRSQATHAAWAPRTRVAAALVLAAQVLAALVASTAVAWWLSGRTATTDAPLGPPVRIRAIEDGRATPGVPDEELLRLTSGTSAVTSLRPALAQ